MRSRTSGFLRGRTGAALVATAATVVLAAGCGTGGGTLADQPDPINLSGQSYTVGGKSSPDQQVLCQMAVAALESVGADVTERCNLGDAQANRDALTRGDIDMYWESTGTAWTTFLKQPLVPGASPQYKALADKDQKENHIVWLEPTWFDPTGVFAVKKEQAQRLKLTSYSDMAGYFKSGKPGNLCIDSEFQNQKFGLAALQQAYGFQVPPDRVRVLPADAIYQATGDGQQCMFGLVTGGDQRLVTSGLKELADDQDYYPGYNSAISIRQAAYDKHQDIARVFAPIAHRLTDGVLAELTRQVADGKSPRDAARGWLQNMGYI
ncbi:MAG: glycine betaine ABC transporter substrate-binding protein [Pseudonocardiaceae bacterium]